MDWLIIILSILGVFWVLLFIVPKGNLVHELLHMPGYLFQVMSTPTRDMIVEKYAFGAGRNQYLLLCRPKDGSCSRKHHILYHHGGGWGSGSPEMFKMNAQYFVHQGYWVILPSYRKIPFYSYPEIREDLTLGLQKALEVFSQKQQQHKKIILGGMSAGGNLVGLLLYDRESLKKAGLSPNLFAGMMLFGPPLDLNEMYPSIPLRLYAGKRNSEQFKKASPIHYLEGNEKTPVLCIQGMKDGMVPHKSALNLIEKLDPESTELHLLPNFSHLDAGRWNFGDKELIEKINNWLEKLEAQE